LYSEKYYLGEQIKQEEVGEHTARVGQMRNAYKINVGEPEGRTSLETKT